MASGRKETAVEQAGATGRSSSGRTTWQPNAVLHQKHCKQKKNAMGNSYLSPVREEPGGTLGFAHRNHSVLCTKEDT